MFHRFTLTLKLEHDFLQNLSPFVKLLGLMDMGAHGHLFFSAPHFSKSMNRLLMKSRGF